MEDGDETGPSGRSSFVEARRPWVDSGAMLYPGSGDGPYSARGGGPAPSGAFVATV